MTRKLDSETRATLSVDEGTVREVLGYLNFSNGTPDAGFQRNVNRIFDALGGEPPARAVAELLQSHLDRLGRSTPAFADSQQAQNALKLTFDGVWPAYWRHHADLLGHLNPDDVPQAFFLARVFEAVLEHGTDAADAPETIGAVLSRLNDFVGFRPVAVLENDRRTEPYPHERFRPTPLYLRDAGVAAGRYHDLIERTIEFFRITPEPILRDAHFELDALDELALDLRAHDHTHPVTKRTNYTFGEWDPHQIDTRGRYRRFVIRKIIVDSLLDWMAASPNVDREELLYDASAVLCGTMLMASSISGSGPDTHDSSVSLTSLLPRVARQRDAFYARLLEQAEGARAKRLNREAKLTQQPFGHVRQHLNITLARYGARQVQHRQLAHLYARIGYADASREQAGIIPAPSIRFESEIGWRVVSARRQLDRGEVVAAAQALREVVDLIHRGIECGALVDPWNILGFQGQYPLFTSREDSIPDHRILTLLEILEETFRAFSHAMGEAAAQNDPALIAQLDEDFRRLAEWWDRHASTTVEDLPRVSGRESYESASRVARMLLEWRSAGEAAGDISFWKRHIDQFESAKAYAQVVETLLNKGDHVASRGLLMQWLSRAEDVGLDSGPYSIHVQLLAWMALVTRADGAEVRGESTWGSLRRLFDYLEANAGPYWNVPSLEPLAGAVTADDDDDLAADGADEGLFDDAADEDGDDEDEDKLFEAAYDDVVFRDSARDGHADDTLDGSYAAGSTEIEAIARYVEPHIRFLDTLAELWQMAATHLASDQRLAPDESAGTGAGDDQAAEVIAGWLERTREVQQRLHRLCESVWNYEIALPAGDHDSNVEYDIQRQTKFYLLHTIVQAQVRFRTAERCLRCCLPAQRALADLAADEKHVVRLFRGVLRGDAAEVRHTLPRLMAGFAKSPLLYVAFEHGGRPDSMRDVRMLQSVIRFLLAHLPRLGLLRETWNLLQTVYRMERGSRPEGMAVTEFDQLFRAALKNTLRCVVRSSAGWLPAGRGEELAPAAQRNRQRVAVRRGGGPGPSVRRPVLASAATARRLLSSRLRRRWNQPTPDRRVYRLRRGTSRGRLLAMNQREERLIRTLNEIVERYTTLWLKHSRTMRLSSVEELNQVAVWRDVKKFIAAYGADLFHARMLTLGNIRTILHGGVERFLDYLDENRDPLHPVKLIEDLDAGAIDPDRAAACLELIYESLVDKFERFVEYNTTTTQSDYGEMIHSLLDFLRAESAYERDAWNLSPVHIAHEILAELGRNDAALIWETLVAARSAELADRHQRALQRLEKKYGMRLPSLADHFSERFVKPMAVNRILALVPRAVDDARHGRTSRSFAMLRTEVAAYLETTSGSSIDVPDWLKNLEREVDKATDPHRGVEPREPGSGLPPVLLSWKQTQRQLDHWS